EVVSIVHTPEGVDPRPPDRYARVPLEAATLVTGQGIAGDRKGTGPGRHLNVMAAQTLAHLRAEGFRTGPGEMGEQLVVSGIDVDQLSPGARLKIGAAAVLEVTRRRNGCPRLEKIQGRPASTVLGWLGVMVQVIAGGTICVGDPVTPLAQSD